VEDQRAAKTSDPGKIAMFDLAQFRCPARTRIQPFAGTLLPRGEFLQRKQSVTALNNT
jgi:hypothetical protein